MNSHNLERAIDAALRQLPAPRAPQTLLPRVMASVQAWPLRPWYSRAWVTWPLGWQAVSIAALLLIVAGSALLLPHVQTAVAGAASMMADRLPNQFSSLAMRAASVAGHVYGAARAGSVVAETLSDALLAPASFIIALMALGCAAFGAALSRLMPKLTLK